MKINDYLDEYLAYSKDTKARGTYVGEISLVASLKRCFGQLKIDSINQVKYDTFHDLVRYYKTKTRCKNASINKHFFYFKAVLRFFGFKTHEFLLNKKLPDDTTHTQIIPEDVLEEILRFVTINNRNANSIIHKGIIYLLYDTGARIGELLEIKIRNIDFNNRTILLEKTKNRKQRKVFYSNLSKSVIEDIVVSSKQSKWLFWNNLKNRRMNRDSDVKYLMKMIKSELGIDKLNNHQFRKTMATKLIKCGAKLKTVQTILGHQCQKTTEIYVDYTTIEAKEEYDRLWKRKRT